VQLYTFSRSSAATGPYCSQPQRPPLRADLIHLQKKASSTASPSTAHQSFDAGASASADQASCSPSAGILNIWTRSIRSHRCCRVMRSSARKVRRWPAHRCDIIPSTM